MHHTNMTNKHDYLIVYIYCSKVCIFIDVGQLQNQNSLHLQVFFKLLFQMAYRPHLHFTYTHTNNNVIIHHHSLCHLHTAPSHNRINWKTSHSLCTWPLVSHVASPTPPLSQRHPAKHRRTHWSHSSKYINKSNHES